MEEKKKYKTLGKDYSIGDASQPSQVMTTQCLAFLKQHS